jgi:acetyl-CoA carboxylase carboxyl transferase subunit alpha
MSNPDTQLAVVREIEKQIAELEQASDSEVTHEEIERLRQQLAALRGRVAGTANDPWDRVLLARHPQRPYTLDYIHRDARRQTVRR